MPDEPQTLSGSRTPWAGGSVPVPDPTLLTTQQLIREIQSLREILEAKIAGNSNRIDNLERLFVEKIHCVEEQYGERFKGIQLQFDERDTRTEQTTRDSRVAIDAALQAAKEAAASGVEKTAHLQTLHDEKFRSIAVQFLERDVRTEQTSRDSKVAVDAALQAAKEAVGEQNRSSALAIAKSETATVKQIDQMQVLLQTATAGLESKISDLKDRMTGLESSIRGQGEQRVETRDLQTNVVGIVGLVIGIVVGLAGIFMAVRSNGPPNDRVIIEQPLPGESLRQQTPLQ